MLEVNWIYSSECNIHNRGNTATMRWLCVARFTVPTSQETDSKDTREKSESPQQENNNLNCLNIIIHGAKNIPVPERE
jgi:hypothetical protein